MDQFTLDHLSAYVATIWEDEQDGFMAYVLDTLADDPSLADVGWPTLLSAYRESVGRGPSVSLR